MKRSQPLSLFLLLLLLAACQPAPNATVTPVAVTGCGNGVCDSYEDTFLCPQDCPASPISGETLLTYIESEGIGRIAVLVAYPTTPRYAEGAGIIVVVSPFLSDANGFITDPDFTSIGLIQVSYLWPGQADPESGAQSEGEFDYGGEQSLQVLRDVLLFAAGRFSNIEGRTITTLIPVTPMTEEVGIYAFSHAGIAAVNVLYAYGDALKGVEYLIAREMPTVDTLTCLEAGYRSEIGQSIANPFYLYPSSYSPTGISLNYSNARWDPAYVDEASGFIGRPYLDLDSNGAVDAADYVFGWRVPVMFGKRYFSAALTRSLLDNGALTRLGWPDSLATPEEASQAWETRQTIGHFFELRDQTPDLKVMLVFAVNDNAQAAADKPHIHQAFQGFRFDAQLDWVRLNPDRAYVQQLLPGAGTDYPDNPANTQPADWTQISAYAYPGQTQSNTAVTLAAAAEMADRAYTGRWDENLGQFLYEYTPSEP